MWLVLLASALAAGKVDEVASLPWLWGWVMRGPRCWSLLGALVSSGSCLLAPWGLLPCEVLGLAPLLPSESLLAALCTGTGAEIPKEGGEEENLIVFSLPAMGGGTCT